MVKYKPTYKRKIDKLRQDNNKDEDTIVKQSANDQAIDEDVILLKPDANAFKKIRNRSTDWELTDAQDPNNPSNTDRTESRQSKSYTVPFGQIDYRLLPYIVVEPLYRKQGQVEDDSLIVFQTASNGVFWYVWEVTPISDYIVDATLHADINLRRAFKPFPPTPTFPEGGWESLDQPYETKLRIELINPYEFV